MKVQPRSCIPSLGRVHLNAPRVCVGGGGGGDVLYFTADVSAWACVCAFIVQPKSHENGSGWGKIRWQVSTTQSMLGSFPWEPGFVGGGGAVDVHSVWYLFVSLRHCTGEALSK